MKLFSSIKQNPSAARLFMFALIAALSFVIPAHLSATTAAAPTWTAMQANLGINGFFATDKAQRGRTVQAAIVVDIPDGYHVNGNRPLGKYAVPTILKIEAPAGFRVSPVVYPRATVRRFSFSEEQLAVYENRAVMRFNVTVPASYSSSAAELRVRLRYQSCNNEACFPPATREATVPLQIVNASEPVKRANTALFGGGSSTKHIRRR
jgi:DsbC/DsbD-like thiol-disulfide interchange protein